MTIIDSPNLDLYRLEEAIDNGVNQILHSRKINSLTCESDVELHTPFVSVKSSTRGTTGHRASNGRFDTWNGTLVIEIYTNRTDDVQVNRINGYILAQVRDALSVQSGEFNVDRFPNHDVREMIETGASREVIEKDSLDLTTLEYSFIIMIKPEKWS